MIVVKVIIIAAAAYLLGSISIAVLLSRFVKHEDVREKGSGNAGATNVARVYGFKFGLATLFGDVAKTLVAALIGFLLMGKPGISIACAACIIGHCWPVFFGFKGGKGVAVGAAIIGVVDWRVLIIALGVFLITVLI
ncbi:MAG: glycerol-3-phosphate acyltransferase, partial [Oscillospiraceae bacterium]|nr:glycerol-3-phosphate acyltransferase [Oscillospiraceae bacterium]